MAFCEEYVECIGLANHQTCGLARLFFSERVNTSVINHQLIVDKGPSVIVGANLYEVVAWTGVDKLGVNLARKVVVVGVGSVAKAKVVEREFKVVCSWIQIKQRRKEDVRSRDVAIPLIEIGLVGKASRRGSIPHWLSLWQAQMRLNSTRDYSVNGALEVGMRPLEIPTMNRHQLALAGAVGIGNAANAAC